VTGLPSEVTIRSRAVVLCTGSSPSIAFNLKDARIGFSLDSGELLSCDKPAKTMGATDSQTLGTAAQTGMHMLLEGAIISVIIAAGTYMYLFLNEIGHSTSSMALFELELKPLLSALQ
jgi:hypothetical protein